MANQAENSKRGGKESILPDVKIQYIRIQSILSGREGGGGKEKMRVIAQK